MLETTGVLGKGRRWSFYENRGEYEKNTLLGTTYCQRFIYF